MQFSDTTNKTGLVEDVDFLCNTDSTVYPLADKARSMNRWEYTVVTDILRASTRWVFDDSNQTTHPVLTFTLVEGQNDYGLPTDHLKINALEIKDVSGNWQRIKNVAFEDLGNITDFQTGSGMPSYYYLYGDSLWLEPAPTSTAATLSSGGKIYISREIDAFTASDDTQQPGFAEPFHRILSLGAAYDWHTANGSTDRAASCRTEIERLRTELRQFYGEKNTEDPPKIKLAHRQRDYR